MAVLSSYKDQREKYIGYFEVSAGLGALFGPLIGAVFYFFIGFKGPFLGIGLIYFIMVIVFLNL
jgi:MFS family permease